MQNKLIVEYLRELLEISSILSSFLGDKFKKVNCLRFYNFTLKLILFSKIEITKNMMWKVLLNVCPNHFS